MDQTSTQPGAPRPLSDLLEEGRPWSLEESVRLLHRVALQVRALHEGGRIHLSINVEAVWINDLLQPRLDVGPRERRFGGVDSDPEFCPPELAEGESQNLPQSIEAAGRRLREAGYGLDPRRIDVYQLGTLLCRLLSGESIQAYTYRPKVKGSVSAPARLLLERTLGYDAADRFEDCDQLLEALEEAERQIESESVPPSARPTPPRGSVLGRASDTPPAGHVAPREAGEELESSADVPFERLGHYRILARIGSGGMGDVFRGYDETLDRYVAVKVLPAELARDADFVRRFRAEATAAAKLGHPNVVPIFTIDEDRGHHFFAMQYVEGESLALRLSRRQRLPLDETLRLVKECLAGLEAAHHAGLIHRDVKPANILIDAATGRVLLVDFGLVRKMGQSVPLTATGVIMGTVEYIAPEQARGQAVDGRADLYSLGVLFYQMLAGRLPFEAETPTGMLFQHAYEEPRSLEESAPDVPPPLAALVARMMAKDPNDRHQNAREVLDDIEAFHAGRPVAVARPSRQEIATLAPEPTLPERLDELADDRAWRRVRDWAGTMFRRHAPDFVKELQSTTQQVDGAVAAYERRRNRLAQIHAEARALADDLSAQLRENIEAASAAMRLVESVAGTVEEAAALEKQQECEENVRVLRRQLDEQREQVDQIELQLSQADATLARLRSQRDALNARLKAAHVGIPRALVKPKRALVTMLVRIAIGSAVGALVVSAAIFFWPARPLPDPSSSEMASTGSLEQVPILSAPALGEFGEWIVPLEKAPRCLAVEPTYTPQSGFGFVTGNEDGTISRFSLDEDGQVRESDYLYGHLQAVRSIAFSPDGKWVATASGDGTVRIWDSRGDARRNALRTLEGRPTYRPTMMFSTDGDRLLLLEDDTLCLWDVITESVIRRSKLSELRSGVQTMDWSRDGTRVLMGARVSGAQSLSLWNLADDFEELVFDTDKLRTSSVAFARFEDQAYSLSSDSIRVYDLTTGESIRQFGSGIECVAFSPSTYRAWSADRAHALTLWDTQTGSVIQSFSAHTDGIEHVGLSVEGTKGVSVSRDGTLRIWDLPPLPPPDNQLQALANNTRITCVALSSDGAFAVTNTSNDLGLWNLEEGVGVRGYVLRTHVAAATFSSDGRYLLYGTGTSDSSVGIVALRDVLNRTYRDECQFKGHQGQVTAVAISLDGRHAISGSTDGSVRVWDLSGQETDRLDVGMPINSVALAKSESGLLIGASDEVVRLWKWNTTGEVRELVGHEAAVLAVAASADGKRAASASGDGTVRVWDVETGGIVARLEGHTGRVHSAAISEHGLTVLSGGDDTTVRLWDVDTNQEIQRFEGHLNAVRSVALSRDGTRAISGGDDWTLRLWKLPLRVQ